MIISVLSLILVTVIKNYEALYIIYLSFIGVHFNNIVMESTIFIILINH